MAEPLQEIVLYLDTARIESIMFPQLDSDEGVWSQQDVVAVVAAGQIEHRGNRRKGALGQFVQVEQSDEAEGRRINSIIYRPGLSSLGFLGIALEIDPSGEVRSIPGRRGVWVPLKTAKAFGQ